jgi:ribosomal protein RSM22 (predicted rRNA methylase)
MLTARQIPRACQSCRLHLQSLFEQGFTNPITINASRPRYATSHVHTRTLRSLRNQSRGFSTTRICTEEVPKDVQGSTPEDIEAVVRQARQTFGETLPKDYLSTEEYILYERLYGPPLRETRPEDLEYVPGGEEEEGRPVRNVLLRQNSQGGFDEVDFDPEVGFSVVEDPLDDIIAEVGEDGVGELAKEDSAAEALEITAETPAVGVQGKNQREIDAISQLQRDMEAALANPIQEEEEVNEEEEEEEEEGEEEEEEEDDDPGTYITSNERLTHPHTMDGRSGTSPSTISLPREQIVEPISELLARTNWKHLTEAAEKAFGGKGLPHSTSTPAAKKLLPQKHIGLDAAQHSMSQIEADAYIAAVMPGIYASVMSTLVEVRKRLGSDWVRDLLFRDGGEGPKVLDAGAGGAGIVAWREILQAEWDILKDEGIVEGDDAPSGKTTVLTGPSTLRHRVSRFLDNTTFLPRLPDYIHASSSEELLYGAAPQGRKNYDLIIAPHLLFPLKEDFRRKNMVQNLWSLLNPNGGVLILIEKGLPRGFEAIAGARSLLLDSHISSPGETAVETEIQSPSTNEACFKSKEDGMIIAPCTNHESCPMYPVPGLSTGRKDFCHFGQRYLRPPFLQKVLGASMRNYEDVKFSYIAVRRGIDARKATDPLVQGDAATEQAFAGYEYLDRPDSQIKSNGSDLKFNPLSLPRAILPPLKRQGHVTIDLCTPSGKLERWVVPKSFSRAAYRDARKSKWGDLWALGAKTRTMRKPRLGRLGEDGEGKAIGSKAVKGGKKAKAANKNKKNKFDIIMGSEGMESIQVDRHQAKYAKPQKRTKGGRVFKEPKLLGPNDL